MLTRPGPRSRPPRRAGTLVRRGAMAGAILIGMTAGGCATGDARHAPPAPRPRTTTARVRGVREEAVERAVRRDADAGVRSASCRPPGQGGPTPFGAAHQPVLHCLVGTHHGLDWYEVEVLRDGCFLGVRDDGGGRLRGCGVNELHVVHET